MQNTLKRNLGKEMFLQALYKKALETMYDTAQAFVRLLRTHRGRKVLTGVLLLLTASPAHSRSRPAQPEVQTLLS